MSAADPATLTRAELIIARVLRDTTGQDVVRLIGRTLSDFRGAADMARLVTPADVAAAADGPTMFQAFLDRAWQSHFVTPGAKRLLSDVSTLEAAFRLVVTDKQAREELRTFSGFSVARVAEEAAGRVSTAGAVAASPGPGVVPGTPLSDYGFGEACEAYGVGFTALQSTYPSLSAKPRSKSLTLSLADFVAMLAAGDTVQQSQDVAAGILRRSEHFVLVLLFAADEAGRIEVHPNNRPMFRLFCVRALLSLNAIETAYGQAAALRASDAFHALPQGEQARLETIVARAAVRSGRAAEVIDEYVARFATDDSVETFRVLLGVACVADPPLAEGMCHAALSGAFKLKPNDWVFIADLVREQGRPAVALGLGKSLLVDDPSSAVGSDAHLGMANVAATMRNHRLWSSSVVAHFGGHDLNVECRGEGEWGPFAFRPVGGAPTVEGNPLVTIVMTTFNAADTVARSIASVQDQSCGNWELIVVDDVSTDDTVAILHGLAREDDRIRVLERTVNEGTYRAKNEGIKIAAGEFVTFHDSDDWMHPMRLERHLEAMRDGAACSTSMWIRMDLDGVSIVRRGGPYRHMNPASTFFRRAVFDTVGLFDAVRTGADSEMLARVRATLGQESVVAVDQCLGIGLHHENSLTRTGAAAFDEFRHSPVRVQYWESWIRWHAIQIADQKNLYNVGDLDLPYEVPDEIRARRTPVG